MIQKMKRMLLHWACMMIAVVGLIGCNPPHIEGGDDEPQIVIELARCWQLSSFCGEPTDVDICIDFRKDGKFTIYQRTEELAYTTFTGTYTADEEKSLLSGVYSDGVKWASSYHYTVDKEAETLTLESVERPSEVSIYVPAKVPASATLSSRCASANDVRPL
jgi:hypothetical protein